MFRTIVTLAALSRVLACPDHAPSSEFDKRDDEVVAGAWDFDDQAAWATDAPLCGNGTMQSPIDLKGGNFSTVYAPKFDYTIPAHGTLKNWGYGPSFDFNDTSTTPTFTVNNTVYYLLGFHTHTASEHTIDGKATAAEVHLVHGDISGVPKGVVGFPIVVGKESPFFKQFLVSSTVNIPAITSKAKVKMDSIDMSLALTEGGNLKNYWTYRGSLTTPPCTQGKRWWVSGKSISMSQAQMDELLSVSADSNRATQRIQEHDVGKW
ncbi:carbonic anhydrase [Diplocarpon rosae]|nr:carbonic anhydrase [Diplocarpon rosae]